MLHSSWWRCSGLGKEMGVKEIVFPNVLLKKRKHRDNLPPTY